MSDASLTLLDACAVINLFATGRMEEIIEQRFGPVGIVDVVAKEARSIYRSGADADADADVRERESISLQTMIDSGHPRIIVSDIEEELQTYVAFLEEVNNGEAMTIAVAVHRGCAVVTDDRKALRVLQREGVPAFSTLAIIKRWADDVQLSRTDLQIVLVSLLERGNYLPPRRHPLWDWWAVNIVQ